MFEHIIEIFNQGGYIMFAIALCSVVAWYLFFHNWQKIKSEKEAIKALEGKSDKTPRGSIFEDEINTFLLLKRNGQSNIESLQSLKKSLNIKLPRLEERINSAGTFIQITPLLGLLGTVSGMIMTFEYINSSTTNNEILAKGISQALFTTEYGLLLSIPGVYFTLLSSRSIQRLKNRYQTFIRSNLHGAIK